MDPQAPQPTPITATPNDSFSDPTKRSGNSPLKSLFTNKLALLVVALVVLIGVIGGLYYLATRQSKTVTVAPDGEKNVILATIGTTQITKEYVRNIALESYIPKAIDNKVIKEQLDVAVERVLLEKEALRKGIEIPQNLSKDAYYDFLRNKVTEGQILSVEEQDISWWIPPAPDYEQLPIFAEQRNTQQAMADEIERQFQNGADPLVVAKEMIQKYSVFENILGYNGQIVKQMDPATVSAFRVLQYSSDDASKPFFNMLYSMGSNEVRKGIWENGAGGAVVKTGVVTNGQQIDYNQWLQEQIKTQVKFNEPELSKL